MADLTIPWDRGGLECAQSRWRRNSRSSGVTALQRVLCFGELSKSANSGGSIVLTIFNCEYRQVQADPCHDWIRSGAACNGDTGSSGHNISLSFVPGVKAVLKRVDVSLCLGTASTKSLLHAAFPPSRPPTHEWPVPRPLNYYEDT